MSYPTKAALFTEAVGALRDGSQGIEDMGALFMAIQSTSEAHSLPYKLAVIGEYLATDRGSTLDCHHESLIEGITAMEANNVTPITS